MFGGQQFATSVPSPTHCTDWLKEGVVRRKRHVALRKRYLQFNSDRSVRYLIYDLDYPGAAMAYDDAVLPAPNIVVENPTNGHAHVVYGLAAPVTTYDCSRTAPIKYLAAVDRGLRRRLDADRAYAGFLAKNPLHEQWRVSWPRVQRYDLDEIADWLFPTDMRPETETRSTVGWSRNCFLFDEVRQQAYRDVITFKRAGRSEGEFRTAIERYVTGGNSQFSCPLRLSEVRAIAKSISRWTWRNFSIEKRDAILSRRQRARVMKRWAGVETAAATKPWEETGVSRRTYYRRKKAAKQGG